MKTGSFLAVIALSLAIMAGQLADTVKAQGPDDHYQVVSAQAPDNTKANKDNGPTADDQKMNASDRDIAKRIRASITSDKSLSTYGHNVKVISQNGHVTLKGPVRSDDEKANIGAKAAAVIGENNVDNQLEVAPKQ
jgi:hyperosmotically inducible periplasmic protein